MAPGPKFWDDKSNCLPERLDQYDWRNCYWSCSHTVRVRLTTNELVNYDTGEVIGTINKDYSFYMAHGHIHICRTDWDRKTYPLQWFPEPGEPVLPEKEIGE